MCVYEKDGKCQKFSDGEVVSYCVQGPCEDARPSNYDRIRSMSIDEMAVHLSASGCNACPAYCICKNNAKDCWLIVKERLEMEAE